MSSIIYIVAGFFTIFGIAVIIYVIKVYKEDKKDKPKQGFLFEEDDDILFRP